MITGRPVEADAIVFEDVSKFYGEVLGVNRVDFVLPPGITGLVGPNGAGKSTLMNLMTGLLRPTGGRVRVLGEPPSRPEALFRLVGYATQYDTFPGALSGREYVTRFLAVHGFGAAEARTLAEAALARVGMTESAGRRIAAYSKGMRQRIKLARAIAHQPAILLLDEPLNGLDPIGRAEMLALFRDIGREGLHVLISTHILHEVDALADRVLFLEAGYVVAQGEVHGVRRELSSRPMQILVRCDRPERLAALLFATDHVVEVRLHEDRAGLLVRTTDAERCFADLNRIIVAEGFEVEAVAPADDDVQAVYHYLIGPDGALA